MTMHWLPAGFVHPLRVGLMPGVHLRPISPDDTEIDMVAVMGNQAMLWDKYGGEWEWPQPDMTADEDRRDLARHADEMVRHESFNYAIMPDDESAIFGCIYIDPPESGVVEGECAAEVSWWVVAEAPMGVSDAVAAFVPAWLEREWPFESVAYPFGEVG